MIEIEILHRTNIFGLSNDIKEYRNKGWKQIGNLFEYEGNICQQMELDTSEEKEWDLKTLT